MNTTGAGAKATAIFFIFLIGMIASLRNNLFCFIATGINSGAGYARQYQQVNTEYEQDCFHAAKIMAYALILIKQGA